MRASQVAILFFMAGPPALVASSAHAQPSVDTAASLGADEVVLASGGHIRGTVVVMEPEKEVVVIVGGTGEKRAILWSEVTRVERGKYAPSARAPEPTTVKPEPNGRGIVRVHIETSNEKVQLHRSRGTMADGAGGITSVSDLLCRAPCGVAIDGRNGEEFFFTGPGIPASSRFQVYDREGDLRIPVSAGSKVQRGIGIASMVVGGIATLFGGLMYQAAVAEEDTPGVADEWRRTKPIWGAIGLGGVALAVTGFVLWMSGRTTYDLPSAR